MDRSGRRRARMAGATRHDRCPRESHSVLLPEGRVLIAGGTSTVGNGGPAELFDAEDPTSGFQLGPTMKYQRGYHSAAILLPDGSVVMGGDPNGCITPNERYLPSYFFKPRPTITGAPATRYPRGWLL